MRFGIQLMIAFVVCGQTSAYNILGFILLPVKSHYVFLKPLFSELVRRGHNLTLYSVYWPENEPGLSAANIINLAKCFPIPATSFDLDQMTDSSTIGLMKGINTMMVKFEEISECSEVANLVNSTDSYDAFVTDLIFPDWYATLAYKFAVPLVNVFPNALFPQISDLMGSPTNPSYIPFVMGGNVSKMSFLQRMQNFWAYMVLTVLNRYYFLDPANEISRKVFGNDTPDVEEIVRNTSLMLVNVDFSYKSAFPLVPNVIPVAGMNVQLSKPLPENIEKFINESKHGVVYFCMGSLLRGETFPPEKREAFLYAFSKIPQRVLWKWEGDVLPGKSDNIMISKWMPQRDILAHPNVKLFISHGGLLGTSEAVYEGVPVLGIPIFGDQRTNIKSLEANGAGELLDYNEISKEVVLEKIQRLLNDPKYKENAKLLSDRYRDRPMSPLDTAVYWTEYVIRHKGAPHLRTAAADMPWYQYLLLDVIAFLVAVLVAGLLIVYYSTKFIIRMILRLICGSKKCSSKPDKKVKRN